MLHYRQKRSRWQKSRKEVEMVSDPPTRSYLGFGLGFLCSSIASLLDRFAGIGQVANFARGALDGLSVVAFGAAIFASVSAMRRRR
jgi:hypothetical protein